MRPKERWQDWALLVLGVWLFFAPIFTAYASAGDAAALNAYGVGALVAGFAASAVWTPSGRRISEWVDLVLGLWLVAAPFALGFYASENTAAWHQIVLGVLIAGNSALVLAFRIHTGSPLHQP